MPTQSLVLRGEIGRRLTISEMDGNFTYLESLANSEHSTQPDHYIPVGTGTGLTSSESFTFDYVNQNLILKVKLMICILHFHYLNILNHFII